MSTREMTVGGMGSEAYPNCEGCLADATIA
jgi:hypothetical protein